MHEFCILGICNKWPPSYSLIYANKFHLDFDLSKKSGHHGKNIQDFFENILLQIIF